MDPSETTPTQAIPPVRKGGIFYKSGFFRKTLHDDEHELFDALYNDIRRAIPDLDDFADDALLIEFVKNQIKLQRKDPPPAEHSGSRGAYDYTMARSKLMALLADQLGMTRKQRKEHESGKDIESRLMKFFNEKSKDASRGRTIKKEVVIAEVNSAVAKRFASESG